MNARTVIAAVAALTLAAPVAAGAKVVPAKHPTRPTHVVTHKQPPRVLCICITTPPGSLAVESDAQFEADVDADMIAHGLDPIYGTTSTDTTADTSTTAG
jgi:hypothetical protein